MKKLFLFIIPFLSASPAMAQVTSLHENFNSICSSLNTNVPTSWSTYYPVVQDVITDWHCTPAEGRDNTGGMVCTGYNNGVNNLDTSYLFTPPLELYFTYQAPDSAYLQFDTKTTYIGEYSDFHVLVSPTNGPDLLGQATDITASLVPVLGNGDESDWVTHQVNITPYIFEEFYIAFRYTSADTTIPSLWYLDNVNITDTPLNQTLSISSLNKAPSRLTIVGNSTQEQIKFSYTASLSGQYYVAIYDILGREMHKESFNLHTGANSKAVAGLHLTPGMYFVKMNNGSMCSVATTVVN